MKYIVILSLLVLVSCKPSTIKVVSSYQYGFEIAKPSKIYSKYAVVPVGNFVPIGDFCLKKSPKITNIQSLINAKIRRNPERYKVRHNYNITEIILWLNNINNCNDKSDIIYLNTIESETSYYEPMRHNGYSLEININANKKCSGIDTEFSSASKKSIYKPGKLLVFGGAISEKATQSLIAALIVLTYYDAISNIYNQIKEQCNN